MARFTTSEAAKRARLSREDYEKIMKGRNPVEQGLIFQTAMKIIGRKQ